MTLRLPLLVLLLSLAAGSAFTLAADDDLDVRGRLSLPAYAQDAPPVALETLLGNLASLDYYTRTNAARLIRRRPQAEVVPALAGAVAMHSDEFVRYRALVLLTAFGDRGTRDLMVSLLRDRNDRIREVAYKWLERHPDPALAKTLLAALQTEQAEFVRPALVAALAAVDDDELVQRALLSESMRGLDFFREAVIEALGRQRAAYAVETIGGITRLDGPLRPSAIVALGRIGGARALGVLAEVAKNPGDARTIARAALCLAGDSCDLHVKALTEAASGPSSAADVRAAVAALTAVAEGAGAAPAFSPVGVSAVESLIALGAQPGITGEQAALGFSTVALRRPEAVVAWLDAAPDATRTAAILLLKDGFERLEEEFAEEQFYAAARAAYWSAAEGSPTRNLSAAIIQRLEF